MFRTRRRRTLEMRIHLTHVDWGGVTDSGSRGPLVRFDQSIPPSSSFARTEARRRQSTPANGCSLRAPESRDGSSRPGRSSRWSLGRRGWRESPTMSFAAEEASGAKCFWGCGGSRSKSSRGKGLMEGEKAPGGESGGGEVLVVPEWPGRWRRQESTETGKKTSPGRLRAREAPLRWPEVAPVRERARGFLK